MKANIVKMLVLSLLLFPLPWGKWVSGFVPELSSHLGDSTVVAEVYDSALERLVVNGGSLYPSFDPDVLDYTIHLENWNTDKVYLTLMPRERSYSVNCGGTTLKYGDTCFNASKLEPGVEYILNIQVNIPSGEARSYRVVLKRPHNYQKSVLEQSISGGKQTEAPSIVHVGKASWFMGDDILRVKVSPARIEAESSEGGDDLVSIEAFGLESEDIVEISLDAEAWRKAAELHKRLAIHLRQGMVYVDPSLLSLHSNSDVITIVAETVDSDDYVVPDHARLVSEPVRLSLQLNGTLWNTAASMFGVFNYQTYRYYDRKLLGLYRYNEGDISWTYQPGRWTPEETVTGQLSVRNSIIAVLEMSRQFEDVNDHWAKLPIGVMASKGYIDGMARGKLEPDKPITRAEYTGLLAEVAGLSELMPVFPYTDVSRMTWYFEGISQAAKSGIVTGVEAERFAPDALITREQAATMLMRAFAHAKGTRVEELIEPKASMFSDIGEVSPWALKSVSLAAASGFMNGNPDGSFDPKGLTTRAQAIAILVRLMEILEK
jgi:hypothetical protein